MIFRVDMDKDIFCS